MTTMSPEATTDAPPAPPTEPVDGPQTAPAPPADPGAPFGRTPSGRARSKPLSGRRGRPRGSRNAGSRTTVIGAQGSQRKKAPAGPPDYRPAILRTAQMVVLPLSFRAPVDAWAITAHLQGDDTPENPGMARAISNVAVQYPQVAAVLDKLAAATPISELVGATVPLVVQLLVNHGRLPLSVGTKLGAVDPADVAAALQAQGEQLAQAA